MTRELHRARDQRMRAAGGQADDERLIVDPAESAERLLRRACDDFGADVEQHQQVTQVAGEERHLIGARDQDLLEVTIASIAASTSERESLWAVSSTLTWSAASAASNSVWSSENSGAARTRAPRRRRPGGDGTRRVRPVAVPGSPRSRAPARSARPCSRRCSRGAPAPRPSGMRLRRGGRRCTGLRPSASARTRRNEP